MKRVWIMRPAKRTSPPKPARRREAPPTELPEPKPVEPSNDEMGLPERGLSD
jgi:hypothetical protein